MTLFKRMLLLTSLLLVLTMVVTAAGLALSGDFEKRSLNQPIVALVVCLVIVLSLGVLVARIMARWTTRPLEKLTAAAADIETAKFAPLHWEELTKQSDELGQFAQSFENMAREVATRDRRLNLLRVAIPIGIELTTEKDFDRLLERIVIEAQSLCNADGGTLYLRTTDDMLDFMILRNDSLNIAAGGTTDNEITLPSMHMYDQATGEPNYHNVATLAALKNTQINIPDVYQVTDMDFSGTRSFDAQTGYRSTSFLTIPLEGEDKRVIGVLQLINAQDPETGQIIPFEQDDVIDSLVLLASAALQGYIREESLRLEIQELRIEIDKVKRAEKVAEITESDYFQQLQKKARSFRKRSGR